MENDPNPSTTFWPMVECAIGFDQATQVITLEPKFLAFEKVHTSRALSIEPHAAQELIKGLQAALAALRQRPPSLN
jgi:G:T/U-mismatch repair DNA glycosylase